MAQQAQSKTTTNHDEIRRWVEERGGHPAHVKQSARDGDVGILRIDFPGYSGEDTLEEISWEQFFEKFDAEKLAFLYQEVTASGESSFFNKLIARETATQKETSQSTRGSQTQSQHRKRI